MGSSVRGGGRSSVGGMSKELIMRHQLPPHDLILMKESQGGGMVPGAPSVSGRGRRVRL